MNKAILGVVTLFAFSSIAEAVTLTSNFTITNRVIEKESLISTESAMSYSNNGSGFYTITDTHTDANNSNVNATNPNSSYWGYGRASSIVTIKMKGQRLGYTFNVKGKVGNSSIMYKASIPGSGGSVGVIAGNCSFAVNDRLLTDNIYRVNADSNMSTDRVNCFSSSYNYGGATKVIPSIGVSRVFYLDLSSLNNADDYRKAPPDVYIGSNVNNNVSFLSGGNPTSSIRRYISYNNYMTIYKKPYFDNVTLLSTENQFTVKTVNNIINGSVTVPYVMNGQFTPYDRITLNVTSLNNFSLVNSSDISKRIPYSLSTTLGTRKFQLANKGTGTGTITFTDLPQSASSIQGRFDADFSTDRSSVVTGDYTDVLTAVYQIDLVS
ncbi:fimbrial protein [Yersinia ruckeri]|uniref:fimbrial protein n=1 Tax=Yersinia ruckeri TaxID=29486 RepID=UPI001F3480C2|nr:fimbrial protein [Yersinia ruckeri]EKN4699391.1 fimbrial protein [Yersinia ruckeri]MCW6543806.1 fimbrial protein [Yersinia ruckeri]MCW6565980.1 fimbrial protein [Yersinia ruckeri]MCW6576115.1 fimbrial protein [Yersinia ruckeri]MCW6586056.1 fimbrial protein [Yersinia ruckeri]